MFEYKDLPKRTARFRNLLSKETNSAAAILEYRDAFNNDFGCSLGAPVGKLINRICEEQKIRQKQLALELGVSEGALSVWKAGRISLKELVRLFRHARQLDVEPPTYTEVFEALEEHAYVAGVMATMTRIRVFGKEEPRSKLTIQIFEWVAAAASHPELWEARHCGCTRKVELICQQIIAQSSTIGANVSAFLAVVDEWYPAYVVAIEHLITGY